MLKHLKDGWLVLALALIFGAGLAAVQAKLGPIIEQNQTNEIDGQIPTLVPGADAGKTEIDQSLSDATGIAVRKAFAADGKQLGWVIRAKGVGYSPGVEVLIGLDMPVKKITGVYVLAQQETPGLGSKIDSPWNKQFFGKTTEPALEVVKHKPTAENQIEAISGATISSRGMTDIVNGAVAKFAAAVHAKEAK